MKAESKDGRHYVVRILPYRREEKAALGVVVTFVDVTSITMTARAPRRPRSLTHPEFARTSVRV